MRILVTGANGFIGSALCRALAKAGHAVRGSSRVAGFGIEDAAMVDAGAIGPDTDWRPALQSIDAVVHTAGRAHVQPKRGESAADYLAINADGTRRLAQQAAEAGVGQFIFLSSVLVYPADAPLPLRLDSPPGPDTAYGKSKLIAEGYLEAISNATGMGVTTLRLPLTYGPGVGGNLRLLMRLIGTGIPLPFGGMNNERSLLGVDNLADVVLTLLDQRTEGYRCYLVADGEAVSTPQIVAALGRGLGREPIQFPMPSWAIAAAATLVGRLRMAQQLTGSLTIDSSALHAATGWVPVVGTEQGLTRAASKGGDKGL